MSSSSSAVELSPSLDPVSPYYLHHSDHHGSVTVSSELTSSNYVLWSRSFLLALSIRNKTCFMDGTIKEPAMDDALHGAWMRCNNLIVAWLLRSISPPIASIVFYISSASQIWDTLKKRFSQSDDSRICNLQLSLSTITQGTRIVDAYCIELTGIWEDVENVTRTVSRFFLKRNKKTVFKFINGLNESFSTLKSQVMVMKPFPNLDEVYNLA
uniref:Retrotransposon Copia-like N-terminal domain-containing protein n=1 Tax=Nelumbo nucifera TaxID=4432 RepID=A0A822ZAY2_NELNU|nr:TPA_asm: hypothetical protein HUJ06_014932 [Nelumbo nucifera]